MFGDCWVCFPGTNSTESKFISFYFGIFWLDESGLWNSGACMFKPDC
jgi:hypothetical protein